MNMPKRRKRNSSPTRARRDYDFWLEFRRQIVHVAGIGNVFAVMIVGLQLALLGLGAQIAFFVLASVFLTVLPKHRISKYAFKFERKKDYPFSGAIYWALGSMLVLFIFPQNAAFAGIAVLSIADAASTLFGKFKGKHKLPSNKTKTWEGSAAFFFTAAIVLQFFINPIWGIVIAGLVALVEMLPKVNDNLTIPISTAALVMLLG